ncbi:MAG TPA: TonB-dependent receptor, partial [Gemmatimonadales bacterium]|nr:TonB-dependent receptor [Gemmatimonadales bacterium]
QVEGAIAGTVRDAATQSPIADAVVTIDDGRRGATSDTSGAFRIRLVRSGTYTVTVRRIGYQPKAYTGVEVRAGNTTTLVAQLDARAVELEEIAVEAAVDTLLDPLNVRTEQRFTQQDLRNLPVSSVADALALTAGTVGESVRGGRPGQESFILDGLGVKNQLDASNGGAAIRIPPDILAEASLITNGFSARYGQAISGMVNVVTRDGGDAWTGRLAYETDRPLSGSADRGLDRLVLAADGPIAGGVKGLIGIDLNARMDFDAVNAPAPVDSRDPRSADPYPLPHNSGEQLSTAGKLTIPLGQHQTVRLFGLWSLDQRLLYDPAFKYAPEYAPAQRTEGVLLSGHWQLASSPTARRPYVVDARVGYYDREFDRGTLTEPTDYAFGAFTFDRMNFVGGDLARSGDTVTANGVVPGFDQP